MGKYLTPTDLFSAESLSTGLDNIADDYIITHVTDADIDFMATVGPNRFKGLMWLVCLEGSIEVEMNLEKLILPPGSIVMVRAGTFFQVRRLIAGPLDCRMLYVLWEFLEDVNFDLNALGSIPLVSTEEVPIGMIVNLDDVDIETMRSYLEILVHNTTHMESTLAKPITRALLAAYVYQTIRIVNDRRDTSKTFPRSRTGRSSYVHDFIKLVGMHFRTNRTVTFYAEKLFISPKYLSLVVKKSLGRSAAELIDDFVIMEAKNLLRFSNKNIQQISYELNFPNQSTFGKYFKHITGMSPSAYQRSL